MAALKTCSIRKTCPLMVNIFTQKHMADTKQRTLRLRTTSRLLAPVKSALTSYLYSTWPTWRDFLNALYILLSLRVRNVAFHLKKKKKFDG